MKVGSPVVVSDRMKALADANEVDHAAEHSGQDDMVVLPCGLTVPKEKKEPLRVMLWHIPELGGGLRRPAVREDALIDGYATVLARLQVDVCVVLGLRGSTGPEPAPTGDGSEAHFVMREASRDRGPAEVRRIAGALGKLDPGGGWQAAFPTAKSSGDILYLDDRTTAFLFRAARGLRLIDVGVVDRKPRPSLGLGCKVACASFDAPLFHGGPLAIAAALGVPVDPARSATSSDRALAATRTLPPSCLFAVSSETPLDRAGELGALAAELGARYRLPRNEGTDLADGFWDATVEDTLGLIDNFVAHNPADVLHQDENMHWEALRPPEHPERQAQLTGALLDALLVCDRERADPVTIDELRVVDLVAAMLPEGDVPAPERPDLPPDKGILAGAATERRDGRRHKSERERANDIAEARAFADELSSHWPIVAQLRYRTEH